MTANDNFSNHLCHCSRYWIIISFASPFWIGYDKSTSGYCCPCDQLYIDQHLSQFYPATERFYFILMVLRMYLAMSLIDSAWVHFLLDLLARCGSVNRYNNIAIKAYYIILIFTACWAVRIYTVNPG